MLQPGLPDAVTQEQLEINTPRGRKTVENPLLQLEFPFNMLQTNKFPAKPGFRAIAGFMRTVRHANLTTGLSDQRAASSQLLAQSGGKSTDVYKLLVGEGNWTFFATEASINNLDSSNSSIETPHNDIHNAIGGRSRNNTIANGHMVVTDISSFDPIFWLHHANVDRLTAIWQALHDDEYVRPTENKKGTYYIPSNTIETEDTPLAPFRQDNTSIMWTAAKARMVTTFGYTYPELQPPGDKGKPSIATVRAKVDELYNSRGNISTSRYRMSVRRSTSLAQVMSDVHIDTALQLGVNNLEVQWYLRIRASDRWILNQVAVYVFVGRAPPEERTWGQAKNLIGSYVPSSTFDSSHDSQLTFDTFDIPCTHTIAAARDRGVLRSIFPQAVVPFLMSRVEVRLLPLSSTLKPSTMSSGIHVTIESQQIQPRQAWNDAPIYGALESHGYLPDIGFGGSGQ